MEKDQIESNQHKPNFSLRAACLRWVRICFIEGGKKYFSDQLANLENNMLIELKCCFAAEKKNPVCHYWRDVWVVLFWNDFFFLLWAHHCLKWKITIRAQHFVWSKKNLKKLRNVKLFCSSCLQSAFSLFKKFSQIPSTYYIAEFVPFNEPSNV